MKNYKLSIALVTFLFIGLASCSDETMDELAPMSTQQLEDLDNIEATGSGDDERRKPGSPD